MARSSNIIHVLQVDEQGISLLSARRGTHGVDVTHFVERPVAGADALESSLREFVKAERIADGTLCTVLPRHHMTARILTLPSHDPAEIAGMLQLSAEEYVPYPAHEIVMDHCLLQKLPDGSGRAFVVFAHRDLVDAHVHLLRAVGVEPEHIYLSSACLASAAIAAHVAGERPYALVNLARGGLEVVVLRGARLEYVRGVAVARDWRADGAPANEALEELSVEVRAALSAYRRESEDGEGADRLFLCGETTDVGPWCEALEALTGVECRPASFALDVVHKGAEQLPVLPLVSLGAALSAQDRARITLTLVPESLTRARAASAMRRTAYKAGGLVAAVAVGLGALYLQAVQQRQAYIRELESRVSEVQPLARGVASKQRLLRTLEHQVDRSGTFLEVFARICEAAPSSGINIDRLNFVHNKRMWFEGTAVSDLEVNRWAEALREAGKQDMPMLAGARNVKTGTGEKLYNQPIISYRVEIPFQTAENAAAAGGEATGGAGAGDEPEALSEDSEADGS